MRCDGQPALFVKATVDEVMPLTGLAFLVDDDSREWTVTKSTAGMGLDTLRRGQRLLLHVERYRGYSLVRRYQPAA